MSMTPQKIGGLSSAQQLLTEIVSNIDTLNQEVIRCVLTSVTKSLIIRSLLDAAASKNNQQDAAIAELDQR